MGLFGDPKMACCPKAGCGEPLIATFEMPKKEFYCMGCETYWEFLQPKGAVPSPYLDARHDELRELFDEGERTLPESMKETP